MDYALISLALHDRIATLTLCDPKHLNRVSEQMRIECMHALRFLEDEDQADCVIITGNGTKAFSAGANINEVAVRTASWELTSKANVRRELPNLIENLRIPSIASINGWCLGAGLELALACTARIAARSARLGFPEINLGIIPSGGGTQRLPRMIGLGRAMEMITSGEPIDAEEAFRIGLVSAIYPDEELQESSQIYCQKWKAKGAFAVAAARDSVLRSYDLDLQSGLDFERKLSALCLASGERDEGVKAFNEKRKPMFRQSET